MPAKFAAASGAAVPVVWSFLGYQFEAASMIAGLCACITVRVWVSLTDGSRQGVAIDTTVTLLTLLFTAGTIIHQRPEPFYALLYGTGIAALGAGIIKLAMQWVKRGEVFVGLAAPEERPKKRDADTAAGISAAMRQLHDVPSPSDPKP